LTKFAFEETFQFMNPEKEQIINETADFVRQSLSGSEGGHDWWHAYRVWKLAKMISLKELSDQFTVELGALLHDIADAKFHQGNEETGPAKARSFLESKSVDEETIKHIEAIIRNISYKNSFREKSFYSPELAIVQDADRLDAMGAIGIARTFNYGGHINAEMYNPEIPPRNQLTEEQYKASRTPTLNHFYEKLLTLKNKMNTKTGRKLAENRHFFMERYLIQFYKEWDGDL
jgi:uncharacterized protein